MPLGTASSVNDAKKGSFVSFQKDDGVSFGIIAAWIGTGGNSVVEIDSIDANINNNICTVYHIKNYIIEPIISSMRNLPNILSGPALVYKGDIGYIRFRDSDEQAYYVNINDGTTLTSVQFVNAIVFYKWGLYSEIAGKYELILQIDASPQK